MSQSQNRRSIFQIARDTVMLGATILGVERALFDLIKDKTPTDLFNIIEANEPVTISDEAKDWIQPIYKRFRDSFESYDTEIILEKLRKKRPDMWSLLVSHPQGIPWLEQRIEEVKAQLAS